MQVTAAILARQLTPNLIQLTSLRFVNAVLVREDDGFTLVDTGVSGSGDALLEAAAGAGAPIGRIALAFRDPESETGRAIERAHRALG